MTLPIRTVLTPYSGPGHYAGGYMPVSLPCPPWETPDPPKPSRAVRTSGPFRQHCAICGGRLLSDNTSGLCREHVHHLGLCPCRICAERRELLGVRYGDKTASVRKLVQELKAQGLRQYQVAKRMRLSSVTVSKNWGDGHGSN